MLHLVFITQPRGRSLVKSYQAQAKQQSEALQANLQQAMSNLPHLLFCLISLRASSISARLDLT